MASSEGTAARPATVRWPVAAQATLAADAAAGAQWGFLLLEGARALVSLLGLAAAARGRWRGLGRRHAG